jgi:tetratricopeptide (TPR) repeat protein
MGWTYEKLGRWQDVVTAYQQAVRLNPDDAMAHYNLGSAYLKLGDKKTALAEYRLLKTLDVNQANRLLDLITR